MSRPAPPKGGIPLPTRDGVSPSCIALPYGPWQTMGAFFAERFPAVSAPEWDARMAMGEVVDERGEPVVSSHPYRANLRVYYYRHLPDEPVIPFDETVLFQDDYLVVADKPHFLPVTPGGRYVQQSLLVRLKRKLGIATLSPIHRIDRETAGLVLFSIRPETRGRYQSLFVDKLVTKHYEAIAPLRSDLRLPLVHRSRLIDDERNFMQMREASGEPNSETHVELIAQLSAHGAAWGHYRLTPVTGRRHQLRAHCAALGIPILHDLIYPRLQPENSDDYGRPLQLLARSIAFCDPITGQSRRFESERSLRLPSSD